MQEGGAAAIIYRGSSIRCSISSLRLSTQVIFPTLCGSGRSSYG